MAITSKRGSVTGTSAQALPGESMKLEQEQEERDLLRQEAAVSAASTGAGLSISALRQETEDKAAEKKPVEGADTDGPYAGMTPKEKKAAMKAAKKLKGDFTQYPHLLAIKPNERYLFHSDYFQIDGGFATVLAYFHDEAARDDFGAFWGIGRIPNGLDKDVSVTVLEQVRRMGDKWIDDHMKTVDKLDKLESSEQESGGTMATRRKAAKVADDMEIVSGEIQDGASYLHVQERLLVKASTLAKLDESVEKIGRLYVDRFGTLKVAAYPGEQRQELSALFKKNEKTRGKGFHFTSKEFAGAHSLVTNGLNDPAGEYVGYMVGDVNTSAVLLDVNRFKHHIVVADNAMNTTLGRVHMPDLWGSKISQAALLGNGRVVHLVLDGANLDKLGPKLDNLTARLDMNSGDINMFEMFGDEKDELTIFPAHLEKIVVMAEQAYETTENDRSVIRGELRNTLTEFYTDKGMWYRNAGANRKRLRLVNLPHQDVPRLQDIVTYFDTRYRALANSSARDDEAVHAYNVLRLLFTDLLDNNGALFNTHTKDAIDGVNDARRVIYDFSGLMRNGKGIAMAQLVNTIGFAVESLGENDVVVIHGAEEIDDRVKKYIGDRFRQLYARGGRVAFLYNEIEEMLKDTEFNRFDAADYTILGAMREATVAEYQRQLHMEIPPDLEKLILSRGEELAYLRRDKNNVVFHIDLALGLNPLRQERRARIEQEARERAISRHGETVVKASALVEAQDAAREARVAASGAEARLGMKRASRPKRGPAAAGASSNSPRRMSRGE